MTLPEDYELSICLTDKNNIVIHQEIKILEGYRQEDVDWIINEIKNFANEDEIECPYTDGGCESCQLGRDRSDCEDALRDWISNNDV